MKFNYNANAKSYEVAPDTRIYNIVKEECGCILYHGINLKTGEGAWAVGNKALGNAVASPVSRRYAFGWLLHHDMDLPWELLDGDSDNVEQLQNTIEDND